MFGVVCENIVSIGAVETRITVGWHESKGAAIASIVIGFGQKLPQRDIRRSAEVLR
jgi:hypothetical protein